MQAYIFFVCGEKEGKRDRKRKRRWVETFKGDAQFKTRGNAEEVQAKQLASVKCPQNIQAFT